MVSWPADDYANRFQKLLQAGDAETELTTAVDWVKSNVPKEPKGKKCAVRQPNDVHQMAKTTPCLTSGTLTNLSLESRAVPTLDTGKIHFFLQTYANSDDLFRAVGVIAINNDGWDGSAFNDLKRVNKDGEVHVLCLIAFWLGSKDFADLCADLAFEFSGYGIGSQAMTSVLKLIERDDKARAVEGCSAWRHAHFISEIADRMNAEGRKSEIKNEGERLLNSLREDGVCVGNYNAETLKRYTSLGRRCKEPAILSLLQCWEAHCKRDMLLDNVTTLRAVFSAIEQTEQLQLVIKTLMMEQLAGIRTTLMTTKSKNVARAIVLKKTFFTILSTKFPRLAADIAPYLSWKCYHDIYGIDENGFRVEGIYLEGSIENQPSAMRSRPLLQKLLKDSLNLKHDRTFCNMAADKTWPVGTLDLARGSAQTIANIVQDISTHYENDFPSHQPIPPISTEVSVPGTREGE
ncbi:MAG: hypothetical protein CMC19_09435, partial [Flavobacteriaceae bacterium]